LALKKIDPSKIEGAIISSVVPPLTAVLKTAVRKALGLHALVVKVGMNIGDIKINREMPERLGTDILISHIAAVNRVGSPVIVVGMGTATTITVTDKNLVYQGGLILPGVKLSMDTLSLKAAKLPAVGFDKPKRYIAKNTEESMMAGVLFGNAGAVDSIVEGIEKELGYSCNVIAYGGMAKFVMPLTKHQYSLQPDLLMEGLYRLYLMNK
ncbi:MAG: type III pantothenate kinase, partial [Sphaerochaetaceae bacterium]|nr:type III pantothenate kinase [Sphaerochaetaceae bacterium]